jgi:YVTN family beta-propeller protein
VISTASNSLAATVKVGWRPVDAVVTPDGSSVYVTNSGSDSVSVISTATNTVVAAEGVGFVPLHVSISPDGRWGECLCGQCRLKLGLRHRHRHQYGDRYRAGRNPSGERSHLLVNINTASSPPGPPAPLKMSRTMRKKSGTVSLALTTDTVCRGRQRTTATKSILPLLHSCPGGVRKSAIHSP